MADKGSRLKVIRQQSGSMWRWQQSCRRCYIQACDCLAASDLLLIPLNCIIQSGQRLPLTPEPVMKGQQLLDDWTPAGDSNLKPSLPGHIARRKYCEPPVDHNVLRVDDPERPVELARNPQIQASELFGPGQAQLPPGRMWIELAILRCWQEHVSR